MASGYNYIRGTLAYSQLSATTHTVLLGNPPNGDARKISALHVVTNSTLNMTNTAIVRRTRGAGTIAGYVLDGGGTISMTPYNEYVVNVNTTTFSTMNFPYLWTFDGDCLEFACTFSVSAPITINIDYY